MAERIKRVLPFLLVTLLSVGGVEGFYRFADKYLARQGQVVYKNKKAGKQRLVPLKGQQDKANKNYSIITERSLFKSPDASQTGASRFGGGKNKPVLSTGNFTLIGTITGKDKGKRAVLLNKKKKEQEVFYLGDGAKDVIIKEISRGKVVLDVNGREEVLIMEDPKGGKPQLKKKTLPGGVPGRKAASPRMKKRATPRRIPITAPQQFSQAEVAEDTEATEVAGEREREKP